MVLNNGNVVFTGGSMGLGTTTPNANAAMDITSGTQGLLLPRLALSSTTSPAPLGANVAGMMVFNTATVNDVAPGLYVNNGTRWVAVPKVTNSVTFNYNGDATSTTGSAQTWTVPAGVTSVNLECWGAQGGNSDSFQVAPGGPGGYARRSLTVATGDTLSIFVGGQPAASAGGWNGGGNGNPGMGCGGGGGASDVRVGGVDLGSRVIVAGGGGGAIFSRDNPSSDYRYPGGYGGGPLGGSGLSYAQLQGSMDFGYCAGGATNTAGGRKPNYTNGAAGSLGQGASYVNDGGGGGGGHYGGGSGTASSGGGGSSSLFGGTGTMTAAANGGNGKVVISW